MKYPIVLTMKTSPAIINRLEAQADAVQRNRSQYIRDLINTLAAHPYLKQAINEALPPTKE